MDSFEGFKVICGDAIAGRPVRYIIGRRRDNGEWEQLSACGDLSPDVPQVAAFLKDVAPLDQHRIAV